MARKHGRFRNIEVFYEGNLVSVRVPREDRSSTDNLRVICPVLGQPHINRYEVISEHGVLDRKFPVEELLRVPDSAPCGLGDAIPATGVGAPRITMHALGRLVSTSTAVSVSCNCKTRCTTNRCRCRKNGLDCSVHCHAEDGVQCGNLSDLLTRTEIGLLPREGGARPPAETPEGGSDSTRGRKRRGAATEPAPSARAGKRRPQKQQKK